MKKFYTLLFALLIAATSSAQILNETFEDNTGFTTSTPFFSDGNGDYFGLAVVDDYNGDASPSALKAYTGFVGGFMAGMDLDGEGASLPITIDWTGLDIDGQTDLTFSGEFAEFFDSPGDIDVADFILVQYQIDGGGYQNLIAFEGADFTGGNGTANGNFREDTDFDGEGDGTVLGDTAQAFTKIITGTGAVLDLRLTVSVDAGDEDFAVDTFVITGTGNDSTPPVITCPANININNDTGICGAVVTFGDATATDDTDPNPTVTQTAGPISGDEFPLGDTTVEFTATDASGNISTCTFTVTVVDDEVPEITCPGNITQDNDTGNCGAVVNYSLPTATDNCAAAPVTDNLSTPFNSNNGLDGNMFDVNILEDLSVQSFDVNLTTGTTADYEIYYKSGTYVGFEEDSSVWTLVGSTTGVVSLGTDVPTPLSLDLNLTLIGGNTYAFYVTTTGASNKYTNGTVVGNVVAANSDLEILEGSGNSYPFGFNIAPRVFNGNIIYEKGGLAVQLISGLGSGAEFPVGTTTETYEVTDAAGNVSSCSFDIIVEDVEAPVVTCPGVQIVMADENGNYEIPDYIANGLVTVADNCSTTFTTLQMPAVGTIVGEGTTVIVIEATDDAGNTGGCAFDLVVEPYLGVNEVALAEVSIFPNPAKTTVTVNAKVETIVVYNVLGQEVLVSKQNTFAVDTLAKGAYLVKITTIEGSAVKQLIVQ